MSEYPKVLVLGAIAPTPESSRKTQLQYGKLGRLAAKHAMYENSRQAAFYDAAPESLDEEEHARQLAMQYMLMTADKLNNAVTSENKQLWSDRYTQATSEIYGNPEAETARHLASNTTVNLIQKVDNQGIKSQELTQFRKLSEEYGLTSELYEDTTNDFEIASKAIGDVFKSRFASVYESLELDERAEKLSPNDLADCFERAIAVLATEHDEVWQDWTVVRNPDKDSLSVSGSSKQIVVGMRRAAVMPIDAKGLFTHEVLIHGLRAVNGIKISDEMGSGLSGYLDAEEGLGVFSEYAITGQIPYKNIDRYTDIALALGQIDGIPKTRQQLIDLNISRSLLRNELANDTEKQSEEDILKTVYSNVNRIYRGSLGNEYIGIFTKDIAYQKGFMDIAHFVTDKIEDGFQANDILDYLLQGKFDPTNQKHTEVVGEL